MSVSATTQKTKTFFTDEFLDKFPDFPEKMTALGQFVFCRTYSRLLPALGRRETYKEVCRRVTDYNVGLEEDHVLNIGYEPDMEKLKKEAELLFTNMFNLVQWTSGRSLFIGGTKAAEKAKLANFNCSYISVKSWEDLGDLFYMLLVGTGVGFKCTKEFCKQIPKIRVNTNIIHSEYKSLPPSERLEKTDVHVIENGYAKIFIGDSKEGWVESLRLFFRLLVDEKYENIHTIKISYNSIRPGGERLKTFGGQASGYEPIKEMYEGIDKVLKGTMDPALDKINVDERGYGCVRPVHVLDIGNLIGYNVVIGGVRRTAEIFLFDQDDYEVMFAKYGINGFWTKEHVEHHKSLGVKLEQMGIKPEWFDSISEIGKPRQGINHRRMSNNSIAFSSKPSMEFLELVFDIMRAEGEPGFVNLEAGNARRPHCEGLNPCLVGSTMILTSEGLQSVDSLVGKQFTAIVDGKEYSSTNDGFWKTGVKSVYKIRMENGQSITATGNHKFQVKTENSTVWKEVQDMRDDKIVLGDNKNYKWSGGYGTYSEGYDNGQSMDTVYIYESCSYTYARGLLQGLFDHDGYVHEEKSEFTEHETNINLYSSNLDQLQKVQRILLAMGVYSKIKTVHHLDTKQHYINIVGDQITRYTDTVGFTAKGKLKLPKYFRQIHQTEFTSGIVEVKHEGDADVYDCTIDTVHCFSANGLISHNCAEVLLDSYGVCNLTTINMTQFIDDVDGEKKLNMERLTEAQKLSVRIGLRMTLVELELPHWNRIQQRDRLLGASMTGVKDAMDILGYDLEDECKLISYLGDTARAESDRYAKKLRVNAPLLVSTVKPEGTISQIAGSVSCGLHVSHSPFYIRRVRINAYDPLAKVVRDIGWSVNPEVGTPGESYDERMKNARTLVIDFPVKSGAKRTKFNIDVKEQLDTYFMYQKYYTDHNSSNTISIREGEWDIAREIIYDKWDDFVGVSFLQLDNHTYDLAPYEACDEKTYEELLAKTTPFTMDMLTKYEQVDYDYTVGKAGGSCVDTEDHQAESVEIKMEEHAQNSDCVGGVCPIR